MHQQLIIRARMPGMNDLIDARIRSAPQSRSKYGSVWNAYSDMKREWTQVVIAEARRCKFKPMTGRLAIWGTFVEENRRRDPDNVVAGALKLVLDALVTAKLLDGDGWGTVGRLGPWEFSVGEPRVCLTFETMEES